MRIETATNGIYAITSNNEKAGGILNASSATNSLRIWADPDNQRANSILEFYVDDAERMRIDSTGLITAGTSASSIAKNIRNWSTTGYVELSGDLPGYANGSYPVLKSSSSYLYISVGNSYSSYIAANGAYTAQSDVSLKTNINTLSSGQLNKITNLRGVTYNWIDENKGTETQTGLIAQEVEAEYPEFVTEAAGDLKGVNYAGLVSPLIEAIKELKLELEAAKARITTLENA